MKHLSSGTLALILLVLLAACGNETSAPAVTLSPLAAEGRRVFRANCASCHAVEPNTVIVGPSLNGIATRAGTRVEGQDAETYLLTSVLRPDAYMVEGFEDLMPSNLAKSLSGEDLDAVIAYLLTLE
jgi:mono/diheme cytochrome c family protein